MKRINNILIGCAVAVGLASCSLDSDVYQYKNTEDAFKSVRDVESGLNGAYYALGDYPFLGNYAISLSDMCSGICNGSASSGHMYAYSTYTFSETDEEIDGIWVGGYQVLDRATRTINGAKKVEDNSVLSAADSATVNNYIGQCYALRALASYYLVNCFALPYSTSPSTPGIVLVTTTPIEEMTNVSRSTVADTYKQILADIAAAEPLLASTPDQGVFYMNTGALAAIKARVYMDMGNYADAKTSALAAISYCGGTGTGSDNTFDNTSYLALWKDIATNSNEELFSIKKASDDNLSANSLNTLYGSYYCTVTNYMQTLFEPTDIRSNLMATTDNGVQPQKYPGTTTDASVSNIRILRKSEMSLDLAEIFAREGDITSANSYLMYTAKRDSAYADGTKALPTTTADLLKFISQERIREFFGEGHCLYDSRRMGDIIEGDTWHNFDVKKFVFPIPSDEVNSGWGVTQNADWFNNLPE